MEKSLKDKDNDTEIPADSKKHKDPLHGITLEKILTIVIEKYGWEQLYSFIPVNCFSNNPTVKSSLKFLRKTDWARKRIEALYIYGPPRRFKKY